MATTITIIDDEPQIRRLLTYQLSGAGYTVRAYASGLEALSRLAEDRPDLVLLDVMMPEVSGWDLCRQIRAASAVPIIMLTAKDADDDIVHGLTSGADDYISKPFHMGPLLARIEAVLRRSRPESAPARAAVAPAPAPPEPVAPYAPPQAPAPGRPQPLGVALAAARARRGLSLYDAALACGVRWEFLQAIEQGQYDFVPRRELARATRSYSRLLGIELPARRRRPFPTVTLAAILVALILLLILAL